MTITGAAVVALVLILCQRSAPGPTGTTAGAGGAVGGSGDLPSTGGSGGGGAGDKRDSGVDTGRPDVGSTDAPRDVASEARDVDVGAGGTAGNQDSGTDAGRSDVPDAPADASPDGGAAGGPADSVDARDVDLGPNCAGAADAGALLDVLSGQWSEPCLGFVTVWVIRPDGFASVSATDGEHGTGIVSSDGSVTLTITGGPNGQTDVTGTISLTGCDSASWHYSAIVVSPPNQGSSLTNTCPLNRVATTDANPG